MRRMQCSILGLAMGLAACHDGEATEAAAGAAAPASAGAADEASSDEAAADRRETDPRDQYALAHEIQQARMAREDHEGHLARTRAAWIGRRYRWEVAFVPALCGRAGPCVVMPFDHQHDPEHPIRQGWLPRLELSDDERAALATSCSEHARCVVELSADLDRFELSTEQPTSLTLSNIELHGSRAAAATESWVLGVRRPSARRRPEAAAKTARASRADGLG